MECRRGAPKGALKLTPEVRGTRESADDEGVRRVRNVGESSREGTGRRERRDHQRGSRPGKKRRGDREIGERLEGLEDVEGGPEKEMPMAGE